MQEEVRVTCRRRRGSRAGGGEGHVQEEDRVTCKRDVSSWE